jgi:hypothetical protein
MHVLQSSGAGGGEVAGAPTSSGELILSTSRRCLSWSPWKTLLLRLSDVLVVAAIFGAVFVVHARWIYTHFSNDAYLLDSGWLAYLFEAADPVLHNPMGINHLSFYAHHISPHIFLFGAPLSLLFGFTGVKIFAVHQGLFFGVFAVAVYLIATSARQLERRRQTIATASAICIGAISNPLLQAAAYPHYEIAMLALTALALAAWLGGHRLMFAACLLWLPLVREDGGLYVAVACLACVAVEHRPRQWFSLHHWGLLAIAAGGVVLSIAASVLKAELFPGFAAFSNNYSGHSWDHVSIALVIERTQAMLLNLNIMPVLVGSLLLSLFDGRYCAGVVLLSPLFVLHLLSVRPEHGHFTLYYALPWLLPCVIWVAVFVRRHGSSSPSIAESIVLLAFSLAITAPIHAAVGAQSQYWYVAKWALTRPVVDIQLMKRFALGALAPISRPVADTHAPAKHCVSMGIAALIPNDVRPNEVLDTADDLRPCRTLLLMRGDMQYGFLSSRAEANGFALVARQDNAELWVSFR